MVNKDTGTAGWGPAECAGEGHRTYFGDRYRGQRVQAQPRDAVRRRCLHLASSGTSHWKETQGRSEQGLGAQQGVVGAAPSPAGGGGSLVGAGCGQAAPHSPLADHSHGWLRRHPRLGIPARAGPCKQKPSVTEPSLWLSVPATAQQGSGAWLPLRTHPSLLSVSSWASSSICSTSAWQENGEGASSGSGQPGPHRSSTQEPEGAVSPCAAPSPPVYPIPSRPGALSGTPHTPACRLQEHQVQSPTRDLHLLLPPPSRCSSLP